MDGVATTAVAVAAARALESSRADALVRDPWAAALVRASGAGSIFPERWPDDAEHADPLNRSLLLGSVYIGIRTRFIDDEIRDARLKQVVILGSGLDTRSWRLDWPAGTSVFELDSAEVIEFVGAVMAETQAEASCTRVPIAVDVTAPWAALIVARGFNPGAPTMWVLEGLLPYLNADDQAALLDDIAALSARGSRTVIERAVAIEDSPEARERLATFSRMTGLPMDDVLARADPPDPEAALRRAGWSADHIGVGELALRYGRSMTVDGSPSAPTPSRGGFVTARLG